jgi:hypothetical protein
MMYRQHGGVLLPHVCPGPAGVTSQKAPGSGKVVATAWVTSGAQLLAPVVAFVIEQFVDQSSPVKPVDAIAVPWSWKIRGSSMWLGRGLRLTVIAMSAPVKQNAPKGVKILALKIISFLQNLCEPESCNNARLR